MKITLLAKKNTETKVKRANEIKAFIIFITVFCFDQ